MISLLTIVLQYIPKMDIVTLSKEYKENKHHKGGYIQ
jgi:hypothetical protein